MLNVQYGQQQKATPIYVTTAPAAQPVQTVQTVQRVPQVQPVVQQTYEDGGECMDCGVGGGGGFPTMSYYAIAGLLIIFGIVHVAVGISAAVMMENCDTMMDDTTMASVTTEAPAPGMPPMFPCPVLFNMLAVLVGTGTLYTIAGCLGICAASCVTAHVRAGLKTGFLVLAILGSVLAVGSVAMHSTILVHADALPEPMLILTAISVVGGAIVFILTVTGAGIACCCSPITEDGL